MRGVKTHTKAVTLAPGKKRAQISLEQTRYVWTVKRTGM